MMKVTLSKDKIDELYDKLKHIDEYRDKPGYKFFIESLYEADLILEFGWGLLRLTDLDDKKIRVHGLFWNKGVFRDIRDFKVAGDMVLKVFRVEKIITVFPLSLKALVRLMEKSCFKKGDILPNVIYNGIKYEDGILFSYGG